MTTARTDRRAPGLFVFSGLCLVLAFGWDVAYGFVSDHVPPGSFASFPWWLPLFAAPLLLCVLAGWVAGQWRSDRSAVARAGAAAWCVVAAVLALPLFMSFMCFAFGSCFGD